MADERGQLETRNRELEQRIYNYLEREKKMTEDNQHQIDKAAELNGTLRRQLDEKCREMTQINDRFSQEVCNIMLVLTRYCYTVIESHFE